MKRSLAFIFVLSILLVACNNRKVEKDDNGGTAFISGEFKNGKGSSLWLEKIHPDGFMVLDSVKLNDKAEFQFEFPVEFPDFYAIRNEQGNFISIFCEEADSIYIEGDYYDMGRYKLTGTPEALEITRLNNATKDFLFEVGEYARIVSDSVNSENYSEIKADIDKKYRAAYNDLRNFSLEFLERNKGSLITLLALSNQLGVDFFVFHPVQDYKIFRSVDSILIESYPESDAVKRMHSKLEMIRMERMEKTKKIKVGSQAPEFSIKNPDYEYIQLSDFKEKFLLVSFWASWSAPSREENPGLIRVYEQFKEKDFDIIQIALDRNYDDWIKAIEEDNLNWKHGSELNYWDSEVASLYGVNSLPANYLINKEGVIIAKNLTPSQLIEELKKHIIQ